MKFSNAWVGCALTHYIKNKLLDTVSLLIKTVTNVGF